MPPKKFEGKFGIPPSHSTESQLTSALYRLPESISIEYVENLTKDVVEKVNKKLEEKYDEMQDSQQQIGSEMQESISRSLTPHQVTTLHLKLARHFEDNGESAKIDMSSFIDALVESPKFLNNDRGSIDKLFEIHQVKTLQKIAELRRKRAEMSGGESFNPYENLFETDSGKYYLARLLNMPHLEQESEYMDHCVGTSTSYVSKIKRGEVEIFSFRDKATGKPLVTIEYDVTRGRLLQVKGVSDRISTLRDIFSADLVDAVEKLSTSVNDQGEHRKVEGHLVHDMKTLLSLKVKVSQREVFTRDELLFLYEINSPIQCFEEERDPLIEEIRSKRNRQEDIVTICNCPPEYIATDFVDFREDTQVFCEDTGKKITFFDFRAPEHAKKLPQLIELAKKIKASGSPARLDMSYEGGIVAINFDREKVKDRETAFKTFKELDKVNPPYIWSEWNEVEFVTPEGNHFETIVLSYNNDPNTRASSEKIIKDMETLGLRPLTLEEMTIAGIAYQEFTTTTNKYFIGLTKYSLDGSSCVPVLYRGGARRGLDGVGWGSEWNGRVRFLCVRK